MDSLCNRLFPKTLEIVEIQEPHQRSSNKEMENSGNFHMQRVTLFIYFLLVFFGRITKFPKIIHWILKVSNYTLEEGDQAKRFLKTAPT